MNRGASVEPLRLLESAERRRLLPYTLVEKSCFLFSFELENFPLFESLFGAATALSISAHAMDGLQAVAADALSHCCSLHFVESLGLGRFFVVCAGGDIHPDALPDLCLTMRMGLRGRIKEEALRLTGQALDVLAGHGGIGPLGAESLEAGLYSALCDAQKVAQGRVDPEQLSLLREFRTILSNRQLMTVYQPIVDLAGGEVVAWEALTRGPRDSFFQRPAALFDFAEEMDQVFALEKACRDVAIRSLGPLGPSQKLFLNIHPRTIVSPDFCPGETRRLLEHFGITAPQVVFEITERHRVKDFALFHRTLDHYRSQGFLVAVDDVGTGYSGLWSIAEIRPDFIKLDMSLVRNVDTNKVKRALLETFVTFADRIGCRLIAEGIETESELATLMKMGVHMGQGYHLGRPAFPKPADISRLPKLFHPRRRMGELELKCSIPMRELAETPYSVPGQAQVSDVKQMLHGPEPISAVVVVDGQRPQGLVMSHHLDRALSSQFGISLYFHREVSRIMDAAPLVVDMEEPVEMVAQKAMGREKSKVYDHIIVTAKGELLGVASVQRLLDVMAAVQVEMAKGASPLTGLPGNLQIERELELRIQRGMPFSIIYGDLDNFKAYNDTYGFPEGDKVIQLVARIMSWAVRRHGGGQGFMGHVGGDDFVMVTTPDRAERACKAVTRCFGRLVRHLYSQADRERGFIVVADRSGKMGQCPLTSVSLAIVDCLGSASLEGIGQRAAQMKHYAKSIPGNSFARDRRLPFGQRPQAGT